MNPTYIPNFVADSDAALSGLLQLVWLSVTEARSEYFMSDTPRSYIYGKGQHAREYHSKSYSTGVLAIQDRLNREFGCQYNVCFLNRYDNQKQQLGWHADDSPTMDRNHAIAVVSFGAERDIWWKLQADKGVVPANQRQRLGNGSLFIMPPLFQDSYYHRIPKADHAVGVRISLTFRKYQ